MGHGVQRGSSLLVSLGVSLAISLPNGHWGPRISGQTQLGSKEDQVPCHHPMLSWSLSTSPVWALAEQPSCRLGSSQCFCSGKQKANETDRNDCIAVDLRSHGFTSTDVGDWPVTDFEHPQIWVSSWGPGPVFCK